MIVAPSVRRVAGVEVHIEGQGEQTLLLLHGWPDDHRLWDDTVAALRDRFVCVRFTLPGFDRSQPRRGCSLDEVRSVISAVIDAVSPEQAVTLLLHDWGCFYGYQYAARHAERVQRIVGVDIGDAGSKAHLAQLGLTAKLAVAGYQLWLAAAWRLSAVFGEGLGDAMTRFMAHTVGHRGPTEPITVRANYPYDMQWTGSFGGFKAVRFFQPPCPTLYCYGQRKPFQPRSGS